MIAMAEVLMWHPGTDGMFAAPEDAVPHYRQAGWIRADEREGLEAAQARAAEARAVESKQAKVAPAAKSDEEK